MVVGPYERVDIGGGRSADLYLLRFGADGTQLSPQTTEILIDSLGGTTDVFLFAHGWNNTFDDAAANYRRFINGYVAQSDGAPSAHRPALVGMVWPSISFLMP